jgi:RNA recognition motif-containing protein
MKRMYVGNLSPDTTELSLTEIFSDFGKVRSIQLVNDVFSGKCRGFGFVEMEGHEARAAISALDGQMQDSRPIKVRFEEPKGPGGKKKRKR